VVYAMLQERMLALGKKCHHCNILKESLDKRSTRREIEKRD
jgi:hypothetical protein